MPNFQISITDPITGLPSISSNGSATTIKDYSNYTTNTEVGHTQAFFNAFRKVKFINPDGTSHLFSTLGDGDELTISAAGSVLPLQDVYDYLQGDGVYTVNLYTLPTWGGFVPYMVATVPYVYYNGVIYKCLLNNTGFTPNTNPLKWEVITDIDLLPAKYRISQKYAVKCDMLVCFANKVKAANCVTIGCNWALLPKDKNYSDAVQLDMIIQSIPYLVDNGNWSDVVNAINLSKQICCCS